MSTANDYYVRLIPRGSTDEGVVIAWLTREQADVWAATHSTDRTAVLIGRIRD